MIKYFITLCAVFLMIGLICPNPVLAHKVTVFAWVDGDNIRGESKFSGGRPVKEGQIRVTDLEGQLLVECKTDDQGNFNFKIPRRTALKIELMAGTGHRGEWTIPGDEVGADTAEKSPDEPLTSPSDQPGQSVLTGLTVQEVEGIVEKALDKKLAPLLKMAAESRQKQGPSATEIFGGIGYILGLMGLVLYFKSRQAKS
jgi:nickel transport protein